MPPRSRRLATSFVLALLATPLTAAESIVAHIVAAPREAAPDAGAFGRLLAAGEQAERDEEFATAEASYRDAVKIARELERLDPRRVEALEALAGLYDHRLRRSLAARPYWEEVWEIRLESGTATDRDAWQVRSSLARLYRNTGEWEHLEAFRRLWVELLEVAEWADDDDRSDALRDLAGAIEERRPGDPEALALLERARELLGDGDERRNLTRRLAGRYVAGGRAGEALELLQEAAWRAETEPLFDSQEVADLYEELGEAATEAGRLDLAEEAFRQALAAKSRHLGESHPYLNRYRRPLADLLAGQQRWDEASVELETALEGAVRLLGPASLNAIQIRERLAEIDEATGRPPAAGSPITCTCSCPTMPDELVTLRESGRIEEAIALAARLVAVTETESGPVSRPVADALDHQVTLLRSLDRPAAADAAARRFEILWQLVGPGDVEVSLAAGRARSLAVRAEDAVRFAESEVESWQAFGVASAKLADALGDLGHAHRRVEAWADAADTFARAVEVYGQAFGKGTPEQRKSRRYLADALNRAGRHAAAEEEARALIADLEPLAVVDRWNLLELDYALGCLVSILRATDRDEEAREVDERRQALAHYER